MAMSRLSKGSVGSNSVGKNTNYPGVAGKHSETTNMANTLNKQASRTLNSQVSTYDNQKRKELHHLNSSRKSLESSMIAYSDRMREIATERKRNSIENGSDGNEHTYIQRNSRRRSKEYLDLPPVSQNRRNSASQTIFETGRSRSMVDANGATTPPCIQDGNHEQSNKQLWSTGIFIEDNMVTPFNRSLQREKLSDDFKEMVKNPLTFRQSASINSPSQNKKTLISQDKSTSPRPPCNSPTSQVIITVTEDETPRKLSTAYSVSESLDDYKLQISPYPDIELTAYSDSEMYETEILKPRRTGLHKKKKLQLTQDRKGFRRHSTNSTKHVSWKFHADDIRAAQNVIKNLVIDKNSPKSNPKPISHTHSFRYSEMYQDPANERATLSTERSNLSWVELPSLKFSKDAIDGTNNKYVRTNHETIMDSSNLKPALKTERSEELKIPIHLETRKNIRNVSFNKSPDIRTITPRFKSKEV